MTRGVHRVAAGTKSARKLMAQSTKGIKPWQPTTRLTPEQLEIAAWNQEVERKKAEKKLK